ncbi:hypothetical protein [Streptomyces sp. CT34]|uniref:hypothetical protein n=1 Tax=Streptomyces sp. CT34 TaxID=1553907 RepID=UPI0012FF0139|nr:hypothetical protein [Streptomyces sp. CT34]
MAQRRVLHPSGLPDCSDLADRRSNRVVVAHPHGQLALAWGDSMTKIGIPPTLSPFQ